MKMAGPFSLYPSLIPHSLLKHEQLISYTVQALTGILSGYFSLIFVDSFNRWSTGHNNRRKTVKLAHEDNIEAVKPTEGMRLFVFPLHFLEVNYSVAK